MKFEKYERPDLEEQELLIEGSFLDDFSDPEHPGFKPGGDGDGDEWD